MPPSSIATLDKMHPTQVTIGLREVERRKTAFMALPRKEQTAYLAKRLVPCVRGPQGRLYLTDRHHMCRMLAEAKVNEVPIDLQGDLAHLGDDEFWYHMDLRGWVHPFDRLGRRCTIAQIPPRIGGLVDDPYRALAGYLRRAKGYTKVEAPYEEFIWADFLRRRIAPSLIDKDFDTATQKAIELAQSEDASHMPGWRGA